MRVTLASYDDEPPLGGQGMALMQTRRRMEARGVDVNVVSGRGHHAILYAQVLHRAPLDFSLRLNLQPRLLLSANPDLLHVYGGPGGVLLLRRFDVPLVYTANHTYRQAHGGDVKRMLSPLEARAYRSATKVHAISPSTAAAVRALGVPASCIEVIMYGVEVPEQAGVERQPGRVLFAGRLEHGKGVSDAVVVMRSLLRTGVARRAVVAGGGALEEEVRSRTSTDIGLEVLGAVDRERLLAEYAKAALVLMPSRFEGLGLIALEAQAAGTPVVGYDVDGVRDAVADDGLLVTPGDRAALYRAAVALLSDDVRRQELGVRARARMISEHSWEGFADRLLGLYRSISG